MTKYFANVIISNITLFIYQMLLSKATNKWEQ